MYFGTTIVCGIFWNNFLNDFNQDAVACEELHGMVSS